MTTTEGIIGAGDVGSTLARLAPAADIDGALSNSRGPDTLAGLVFKLGEHGPAAAPAEAGQLVIESVPFGVYRALPAALAGRTVIDTTNYYPHRDGRIADLNAGIVTSSTLVQHLAGAHVAKALNHIDFVHSAIHC